jgi:hypothetical protein
LILGSGVVVRVSLGTFAATCVCDVAFLSDDSFNQEDEGSKADGKVAMLFVTLSYRVCFPPLQYFSFDRLIRQTSLSIHVIISIPTSALSSPTNLHGRPCHENGHGGWRLIDCCVAIVTQWLCWAFELVNSFTSIKAEGSRTREHIT